MINMQLIQNEVTELEEEMRLVSGHLPLRESVLHLLRSSSALVLSATFIIQVIERKILIIYNTS
jgi:hypothetical protein